MASSESETPGSVNEIRRQWALHEDEALAYRLQTEEISQHYSGNRSRNAIVREDAPRAREEQKKEEDMALQQRFQQLRLLQLQAEEDERYAKLLSDKEGRRSKLNNRLQGKSDNQWQEEDEDFIGAAELNNSELDFDILDKLEQLDLDLSTKSTTSSSSSRSSGAVAMPSTSANFSGVTKVGSLDIPFALAEEEVKYLQQEKDEIFARKLQEEIEQLELDKKVALEAQDRELAKMIYEKEKARLKRAKERARLKAAEKERVKDSSSQINDNLTASSDSGPQLVKSPTPSSSSSQIGSSHSRRTVSSTHSAQPQIVDVNDNTVWNNVPPKIPEKKAKSSLGISIPLDFRANPKPLPPNPVSEQPNRVRSENVEPVPPYMPMQGFTSRMGPKNK